MGTLILINGRFTTLERDARSASAATIVNGRIVAVGDEKEMMKLAGPKAEVIDLGGTEYTMEVGRYSVPTADAGSETDRVLRRFLGGMSIFTLLMTVPQVFTIWVSHQAAGVSVVSWGAYLLSALLWFWFGLKQHDKNIYLPCIGWIGLNGAVVLGALIYG